MRLSPGTLRDPFEYEVISHCSTTATKFTHITLISPADKVKWWQIPFVTLVVTGVVFSVIGVLLLIVMGPVVAIPPNGSKWNLLY